MSLTFHACELVTGKRLCEWELITGGSLKRTLSQSESIDFTIDTSVLVGNPDWSICTQPGRTMIVAENELGVIVWDGIIWTRRLSPQNTTISCKTTESIFDYRFVGDYQGLRSSNNAVAFRQGQVTYQNSQYQLALQQANRLANQIENQVSLAQSQYNFLVAASTGEPNIYADAAVAAALARLQVLVQQQANLVLSNNAILVTHQHRVDVANANLQGAIDEQQARITQIASTGEGVDGNVGAQVSLCALFIQDACGDLNLTIEIPEDEPYVYGQLINDETTNTSVTTKLAYYAGLQQPVEWKAYARWSDDTHTGVDKVIQLSQRIGATPPSQPITPRLVFDDATMNTWEITQDYSVGAGATRVRAFADSGVGAGPAGSHDDINTAQDLIDGGMPILDYRFSPTATVTTIAQLDSHAAAMLELIKNGTLTVTMTVEESSGINYFTDIELGDYVRFIIDDDPRWPQGIDIIQRLYSYDIDPNTGIFTPTFYGPDLTRT